MNDEQRDLVEKNHNRIYYAIHKMRLSIDEYYDVAAIGLCKAAINFNPEKGMFSTYACTIISNEIKIVFRKNTRKGAIPNENLVYYFDKVYGNDEKETEKINLIPDPKDFENDILSEMKITEVMNNLSDRELLVIRLICSGYTQTEIGKIIGVTQTQICRIRKRIIKKIKES